MEVATATSGGSWGTFFAIWAVCSVAVFGLMKLWGKRENPERMLELFLLAVPFCLGGFHVWLSALASMYLLLCLMSCAKKGGLKISAGLPLAAFGLLPVSFFLELPAAVDKGQALFGFVKFLPIPLFLVAVQQLPKQQLSQLWRTVPVAGTVMTAISAVLQCIPALQPYLQVNGRLAGFFQYPNTFAAYLLCGVICLAAQSGGGVRRYVMEGVMIFGILQSGSRTAAALLVVTLLVFTLYRKDRVGGALLAGAMSGATVFVILTMCTGGTDRLTRYITAPWESSTFLGRLLYYKDALPVIASHPFGLGYRGYSFLQGSFQTGVYTTRYVHNELMQLLLDVGWIPALLLVLAVIQGFRHQEFYGRWLMVVMIAHSLFDFDFQFMSMAFLLVLIIYGEAERVLTITPARCSLWYVAASLMAGICLCIGAADLLGQIGYTKESLAVYPAQTDALMECLTKAEDTETMAVTADRILKINPHVSLAYSAKALEAFAQGDGAQVITNKRQAIALARYDLSEYENYLDLLFILYPCYLQAGMSDSAEICRQEIISVPEMLAQVESNTDPLAWKIADRPQLTLPEAYRIRIAQMQD